MSAGRGTPRVNPSGGNLTTSSTQADVADAVAINQASFISSAINFPANNLVLTGAFQQYIPVNAPGAIFKFPLGATRGLMAFSYVAGSLNGYADIWLQFQGGGSLLSGFNSVSAGADKVLNMRRILYRVYNKTGTIEDFLPFVMPVGAQGIIIQAKESGDPGNPGTFSVGYVQVDNLQTLNVADNV